MPTSYISIRVNLISQLANFSLFGIINNQARTQEFVLEGARTSEAPKAPRSRHRRRPGEGDWGAGVPLPSRLGGLGERHELPQRGPGRSPGRKRFWYIFGLKKTHMVATNLAFFIFFCDCLLFLFMANMRHLAGERGLWGYLGPSKTGGQTLPPKLP